MHLKLITFQATQPNTGAAAAAATGDSLIVENATSPAHIVAWWADHQVAGYQQLTFPSGHDTTRGFRSRVLAGEVDSVIPLGQRIEVQPQETMSLTIAGSNTAGDVETGCMLLAYKNLPGVQGRYIGVGELQRRIDKLTTVDCTITGAAAGYTGAELINAESDLLLANRDYAVLGACCTTETAAITLIGPDTGNVRIGCPGNDLEGGDNVRNWFVRLSMMHGEAFIPVINSGNRNNTFIGIVQDENNVSPVVSLYLALLKK